MSVSLLPESNKRQAIAAYTRAHLGPRWFTIFLIVMKNIIGSLLYMVPPFLSKYVLETLLPQQNWNLLVIVTVCMVAAPITGSLMIILENIGGRFLIQLAGKGRADLYNGLQHQPLEWLRNNRIGDMLTRILDDTRQMTNMVNGHLGFMIFHVVTIAAGSSILLYLKPSLGWVVLVLWAGQAVLITIIGRHIKEKAANTAYQSSQVSELVRELVSGAAFIKANGKEATALSDVKNCLNEEWEHTRLGVIIQHRAQMLHAALNACCLVLMYVAGGWFVLNETLTIGSLVAFIAIYNWLRPFGASFIEMIMDVIKVVPSVERVTDICFPAKQKGEIAVPSGLLTLKAKQLSFDYGSRTVLDDVSFQVASGSIVSIVGHRGSGKSTLADLMLGLRDPSFGSISLNGIPLSQIDAGWLRRHILCVTQDVVLRSGTILDNIVYGIVDYEMEAIEEAVRIAQLSEWISRLPEGLLTLVGEQALQLSGGERQRISIARALLRKPSVLILDEATSSLDQGTERRLLNQLIQEKQCTTTLIFITHRLDVAIRSDEVLVFNQGRLVERGVHAELMMLPSIYQALWSEQRSNG